MYLSIAVLSFHGFASVLCKVKHKSYKYKYMRTGGTGKDSALISRQDTCLFLEHPHRLMLPSLHS